MQNPPNLTEQQIRRSNACLEHCCQLIEQTTEKTISFSEYMEVALYHPDFGYYQNPDICFGEGGDFVTAPQMGPLFAKTLATFCAEAMQELDKPFIVEFGPGSGQLAGDLVKALSEEQRLPAGYTLSDINEHIKPKQKALINNISHKHQALYQWKNIEQLPKFEGIIILNEVLDALPFNCYVVKNNLVYEKKVTLINNKLAWQAINEQSKPINDLTPLIRKHQLYNNYEFELIPNLKNFLKKITTKLTKGTILIIDYGFESHEYFHPQRHMGTLMTHFQHQTLQNPFIYPALQDITCHINFTEVAEYAENLNLDITNFQTQAEFLLENNLTTHATKLHQQTTDIAKQQRIQQNLNKLTHPGEMGELFKVCCLKFVN